VTCGPKLTSLKVKIIGSTKTVLILDNLKNTFSAEGPFKLQMPLDKINKPKALEAARPPPEHFKTPALYEPHRNRKTR